MAAPNPRSPSKFDAIVVGGGHNGLVAAILLARAGHSVLILERGERVGGAAVSETPFPGVGARLSRYAYLVSLFPAALLASLAPGVELKRRPFASYTPWGDSGLLIGDADDTGSTMAAVAEGSGEFKRWEWFHAILTWIAERVFPTLVEPLRSRDEMRALVGNDAVWEAIFERPLSDLLDRNFESDLVRGLVLTDATIGTFAAADDPELRQNRCFLYHVIGNGTGRWDVPVGGMGALTDALARAARDSGAQVRTHTEAVSAETDGTSVEVECADGERYAARHLLAGLAPAVLAGLLEEDADRSPEGSQLKLNMVLTRLPRLRDPAVLPEEAFTGTFHVNESYEQLQRAYAEAAAGHIPTLPPCELYCHSLTDPSVLSPDLQASGAHALTLFGLHMPARLFRDDPEAARRAAVEATLASVNCVLAEPLEECLARDANGAPCLEARTPLDLEAELGMPGGHIFHRDLAWPFAESDEEAGTWGVETDHPNVWLCGAGARRGGGVSGIPGHNAAQAVISALSS